MNPTKKQVAGDLVNKPAHYVEGRTHEPIDVIEDWELGYCLGNAVKYISRCGKNGDPVEDLQKVIWYLNRRIKELEK